MEIQWALVFFTLFVGFGCGTFVGTVIVTEWYGKAREIRQMGLLISLIAIGAGGLASTMHLGHIERIFGALGHPTSGIFMESTMIGLVCLDIVFYLLALRRKADDSTCKLFGTGGALLAVVLAFSVGDSYVMASRPAWDTLILPIIYVASSAVMGCFSLGFLLSQKQDTIPEVSAMMKRATLIALVVEAILFIGYLVYLTVAPYPDVTRSAMRVLAGNLAPLFWGGLVLVGLLIPGALLTKFYQKKNFALGLVCVVVAGAAFRMMMFLLGSGMKDFFN